MKQKTRLKILEMSVINFGNVGQYWLSVHESRYIGIGISPQKAISVDLYSWSGLSCLTSHVMRCELDLELKKDFVMICQKKQGSVIVCQKCDTHKT